MPDSCEIVRVPSKVSGTAPVWTPVYFQVPASCSVEGCGSVDLRHADGPDEITAAMITASRIRLCTGRRISGSPSVSPLLREPEERRLCSCSMAESTCEWDADP